MIILKNYYGKNVFVSGATSGIGASVAHSLANNGAHVIGIGTNTDEHVEKVGNGEIHYYKMDVTNIDEINKVFENIKEIDIAVLCAGFGIAGPAEIMPIEYAKKQMEVNYFGVLNVCNKILPIMRKNKNGLVIAISSVAGRIPLPMQCHYSSSKYALEAYIEALRIEMKDFNVKTCLIEPGDTKTGFTKARKKYNPIGNPYYDVCNKSVDKMAYDEQHGKPPESVVNEVIKIIGRKNPPVRVAVGFEYKFACFLIKILPSKLIDFILYKIYMPK